MAEQEAALAWEADPLWYKDAIIYQLHVKAFFDSANAGIGDFRGLTAKLDYIQDLGVNTLWLLPFYGWFMLCSAWAKRSVWVWVFLVPLGVFILEGIVFHTTYFGGLIGRHVAGLADLLVGRYDPSVLAGRSQRYGLRLGAD